MLSAVFLAALVARSGRLARIPVSVAAVAFLIALAALVRILYRWQLRPPWWLSWCCVRIRTGERPVKVKALARIRVTS